MKKIFKTKCEKTPEFITLNKPVIKVEPCPFCGGKAGMVETKHHSAFVLCFKCDAQSGEYVGERLTSDIDSAKRQAADAWNQRLKSVRRLNDEK